MQKKLLTAAVAGALAAPGAALAQVEVYGFISVAVQQFKYSESTAGFPSVSKFDVSSHGSNYGVRGRENLGGGLTAWFQIEQNAPMERSNNVAITPASRNTAVGLQGSWGNFFIGQWTTPWADLESLWSIGSVGGYSPSLSIIGRRETTGTAPNPNCVNGHLSGGAAPGDLLPLAERYVADAQKREPADVRARVEVRDERLQGMAGIVRRRGDRLQQHVEERPEVRDLGRRRGRFWLQVVGQRV